MKKVLFIALAILSIGSVNAQKAKFGLKGGLNISNFDYSGSSVSPTLENRINFNAGLFVEIMITTKFAIQPELFYSGQGSKFNLLVNVNATNFNTENTLEFNYINVPVLLKFYPAKNFNLEFGPQISFILDADLITKVNGQSVTQSQKQNFNDNDFGLNFGASYNFTSAFFLNARYYQGLSNIAKTTPGDDTKFKNNVISFGLGYKFK